MSDAPFDQFQADLKSDGVAAALGRLADWFRGEKRFHELFDTRLMEARHRLGLPIILTTPLDELPEPTRGAVEDAYLEACREAGWLLWEAGEYRQAWLYLRPLGDRTAVAAALDRVTPSETNLGDLVGIALHEGAAPAKGLQWVLGHYGVCNAISAYDSLLPRYGRAEQQAAAALLIRHLRNDLLTNVRADIQRREERELADGTLAELLEARPDLLADSCYHIDTSHLTSVVRIARIVEDPEILQLVLDLTEYGRRLSAELQLTGDEPFDDVYPSHRLFFAAQLGLHVEESLDYFRERAERADPAEAGTAAAETYILLLIRLRRLREALAAHARLLPPNVRTSGIAPTLLELASLAEDYDQLTKICRGRDDLLGFAAALISKRQATEGTEDTEKEEDEDNKNDDEKSSNR